MAAKQKEIEASPEGKQRQETQYISKRHHKEQKTTMSQTQPSQVQAKPTPSMRNKHTTGETTKPHTPGPSGTRPTHDARRCGWRRRGSRMRGPPPHGFASSSVRRGPKVRSCAFWVPSHMGLCTDFCRTTTFFLVSWPCCTYMLVSGRVFQISPTRSWRPQASGEDCCLQGSRRVLGWGLISSH